MHIGTGTMIRRIGFMSKAVLLFLLTLLGWAFPTHGKSQTQPQLDPPRSRAFRMGFTPFLSDSTPAAHQAMVEFMQSNADIIADHMESVPWTEALSGKPFKAGLMNAWQDRLALTPVGAKVYLALNPGRGALADYWGETEHDPMPTQFQGRSFSDPIVKQAYLNYCKRAIDYFHPAYLAIGIEVNEILYNAPDKSATYAELHKYVYQELKKAYPDLPIFASITLHGLLDERHSSADRLKDLTAVKDLMPYNDLVGISFYPFFGNLSDQVSVALSFLDHEFGPFGKPFAIVETGEAAKQLTITLDGKPWVIEGSPERQLAYYKQLFAFAEQHRTRFIITFLYMDYDLLWKKISGQSPPVSQAWQNNGLIDANGTMRTSYQLWKQTFAIPLRSSPTKN